MSIVRIFESAEQAETAIANLDNAGFDGKTVSLISPGGQDVATTVANAIENRVLPKQYRHTCANALEGGRTVLSVAAPLGFAWDVIDILEDSGAVDSDSVPEYFVENSPSPFSDTFGIPTLSHSKTTTQLSSRKFTFPSWLGLGLLSNSAAPLSSKVGMSTLSESKKNWDTSLGMPILSKSSGPTLGMQTLTSEKKGWNSSFGISLLSSNSAPLSSIFGMPLLTKSKDS